MNDKILRMRIVFFAWLKVSPAFIPGCQNMDNSNEMEKWKSEIMDVEQAFNDMAREQGLVKAFEFYAADDGVIMRNNGIIKGKGAIEDWYSMKVGPDESLTWKPTFIDVSKSGDLAYSYGDYIFAFPDSSGKKTERKGIFHTVWKRQKDGTWKFVWD